MLTTLGCKEIDVRKPIDNLSMNHPLTTISMKFTSKGAIHYIAYKDGSCKFHYGTILSVAKYRTPTKFSKHSL